MPQPQQDAIFSFSLKSPLSGAATLRAYPALPSHIPIFVINRKGWRPELPAVRYGRKRPRHHGDDVAAHKISV